MAPRERLERSGSRDERMFVGMKRWLFPRVETSDSFERRAAVRAVWGNAAASLSSLVVGAGALALLSVRVGMFGHHRVSDDLAPWAPSSLALAIALLFVALGTGFAARAVMFAARAASVVGWAGGVVLVLVNHAMMHVGVLAVLASTMSFTRGRQLRRFGRVLLPKIARGDGWSEGEREAVVASPAFVGALDEATRTALARQWRENGRTEHASVAAFARLTLDLMALGAPSKLIEDANRDALDEIRHATMCFSFARAIDGRSESPASFPEAARARTLPRARTLALATLAVDSLVDGALHEGVSARIVAKLARRTDDPATRAMLKTIAADEGRHARHGWDVVRWCLDEGGAPVASALRGALGRLPRAMRSELPEAARSGAWERYGIMGEALESEEFRAARAELEVRLSRLLAACAASPSAAPRVAA